MNVAHQQLAPHTGTWYLHRSNCVGVTLMRPLALLGGRRKSSRTGRLFNRTVFGNICMTFIRFNP